MENNGEKRSPIATIIFLIIVFLVVYNVFNNSTDNFNPEILSKNFYYNHLDSGYKQYGKTIYEELYKNKDELKKGNRKIYFTTPRNGNDDVTSLESLTYINTSFLYAKTSFLKENPDIFWIDVNKLELTVEYAGNHISCGDNENYYIDGISSENDVISMETKINENVSSIMKELDKLKDDYSKIKKVHDYLCETITYDDKASYGHNIYGALVEKKCVCDGYAAAFQFFMNKLGIESIHVVGAGFNGISVGWDSNHAWNYVKLNDNWYAVDVTWDDNVQKGTTYEYFLKGSKTMEKNHTAKTKGQFFSPFAINLYYVEENFEYPTLSIEDYKNK